MIVQAIRKCRTVFGVAAAAWALAGVDALAQTLPAPLPPGWTCVGNCGTNTAADGVVTLPPGATSYQWISTSGGLSGAGQLPVGPTGQETNGSFAQTPTFSVSAGDTLNFYFNYITTDGAGYNDYAWAGLFQLQGASSVFDSYLVTARTNPSGNSVPGFGLPGLGAGVTLTPASAAVIPGGTTFSPLGASSGSCYDYNSCGYTGWIQTTYTFTTAGLYSLGFGVTNVHDIAFDTALAFAGIAINQVPIGGTPLPEPGTLVLLAIGLAGLAGLRRRQ